jgi:hypothetical protein
MEGIMREKENDCVVVRLAKGEEMRNLNWTFYGNIVMPFTN